MRSIDRRRTRLWEGEEVDLYPAEHRTMQVHEDDPEAWTGLYDAEGNRLMRERPPFGFRRS